MRKIGNIFFKSPDIRMRFHMYIQKYGAVWSTRNNDTLFLLHKSMNFAVRNENFEHKVDHISKLTSPRWQDMI